MNTLLTVFVININILLGFVININRKKHQTNNPNVGTSKLDPSCSIFVLFCRWTRSGDRCVTCQKNLSYYWMVKAPTHDLWFLNVLNNFLSILFSDDRNLTCIFEIA